MTWRKTWFSYFLWGLSSILICLAYGVLAVKCMTAYQLPMACIAVLPALVLVCYLSVRLGKKKIQPLQLSKSFCITMESFVFAVLFAGGFLARLYSVTDISKTEMFQICSISLQSTQMFETTHGILELYVSFYRNLFYFVGNSWIVAVTAQINMQLIGCVVLYFVARKTMGRIAALVSFAFVLFSPKCISASVTLEPSVLYFPLCVLAAYFLTESVCRIVANQKIKVYQFFVAVLIGLFTGSLIYLDVIGVCVVLFGLTLICLHSFDANQQEMIKYKSVYFILYLVGVLFGLAGMFLFACQFELSGLLQAFLDWEWNYSVSLGQQMYIPLAITFGLREWIYLGVLFFLLLLSVLGFWECKHRNSQFGVTLAALLMLALYYNCPAMQTMGREVFLVISLALLAGGGMQAVFMRKMQMIETEYEEAYEETVEEPVVEPQKEINFIPNPLPLPKKHVKKTMGYGIDVADDKMDFDIEVSEDDDFDI